jgi:hypothetical protein
MNLQTARRMSELGNWSLSLKKRVLKLCFF